MAIYPQSYSLSAAAPKHICDFTLSELRNWIKTESQGKEWMGRIYAATTISCERDKFGRDEFRQEGCSPNFFADRWTLACCKHEMLKNDTFGEALNDRTNHPLFIFVLCSKNAVGYQVLATVAKIKFYLPCPKAYAKYVTRSGLGASRLTRGLTLDQQARNPYWIFGDCHAEANRAVGPPDLGHVHRKAESDSGYEKDNESDVRKLVASKFLIWDEARIVCTFFQKQGSINYMGPRRGNGREIKDNTLGDFLFDKP